MTKLELPLHPKLESIFGYCGQAPKVIFFWDNHSDQLIFDDGQGSASGNSWAYLIWAGHPSVRPSLANHPEHLILLLDRQARSLYAVDRQEALAVLQPSEAQVQLQPKQQSWKEAQQMLAEFMNWLERADRPLAA
jgi:hypothetical protein